MTFEIKQVSEGAYRWPDNKMLPDGIIEDRRDFDMANAPYITGLAIEKTEDGLIVHGDRKLMGARQVGHEIEGYVSIKRKRKSAFSTSIVVLKRYKSGRDRAYKICAL